MAKGLSPTLSPTLSLSLSLSLKKIAIANVIVIVIVIVLKKLRLWKNTCLLHHSWRQMNRGTGSVHDDLIIDCWLLIIDCWLLIADCWLLIADGFCWQLSWTRIEQIKLIFFMNANYRKLTVNWRYSDNQFRNNVTSV